MNPRILVVGATITVFRERDGESGAYVAPTFVFSGQFSVPGSATSVVVTAYAAGNWDTGALGGVRTERCRSRECSTWHVV